MSLLFKDPLEIMKEIIRCLSRIQFKVPWLNLTMPNQTVKNSLKAKKINLARMNFVLENFHVPISPFHSAKFL